jgi:hypothetical protein
MSSPGGERGPCLERRIGLTIGYDEKRLAHMACNRRLA